MKKDRTAAIELTRNGNVIRSRDYNHEPKYLKWCIDHIEDDPDFSELLEKGDVVRLYTYSFDNEREYTIKKRKI